MYPLKRYLHLFSPFLLLVACIAISACSNTDKQDASARVQADGSESGGNVSADTNETVIWQLFAELAQYPQRRATARVVALDEATVAAQVSGQIKQISVREGDAVKRGQVIAELADPPLRLARDRAQALLAATNAKMKQAQRQLNQQQGLRTRGFVSEEAEAMARDTLEVARREHDAQRAALAETSWQWEQRLIISPFDGNVTERYVNLGDWVTSGQAIATITASAREVHAFVAHEDMEMLQQVTEIIFETLGGYQYPLNLLAVSPRRNDRAQDVRIRLALATDISPPIGTAGTLVWRDPRPHLPANTLTMASGTPGVWIKDDAAATPYFVPLPQARSGRDAVVSFPPTSLIAIRGQGALAWQSLQESK